MNSEGDLELQKELNRRNPFVTSLLKIGLERRTK